jgi:fluoroquinolone resistance protein
MTKLDHCQLNNVAFKGSKLLGINFSDCVDIPCAVAFEGCVVDYCSFARMKIPKTSFIDSSMKNVDFTECDLTKSVFAKVDLANAVFHRTILKEADFSTASNYSIDPEANLIRKAKFPVYGLAGLLDKYDIDVVMS